MTKRRYQKSPKINRRTLDQLRNTVAITLDAPKTCALVFEKLVSTTAVAHDAPAEILIYRRAQRWATFPLLSGGSSGPEEERRITFTAREGVMIGAYAEPTLRYVLNNQPDQLCSRITNVGFRPVLCYTKQSDENLIFRAGDRSMIVACIKGLTIVAEDQLTWEQVMEFRKDGDSRAHVARLINWLNEKYEGKSIAQIQDHLCTLLEKRDTALAKFGVCVKASGENFFAVNKETFGMTGGTLAAAAGAVAAGAAATAFPWAALIVGGVHLVRSVWIGVRETNAAFEERHKATAFFHGLDDTLGAPLSLNPGNRIPQLGPSKS